MSDPAEDAALRAIDGMSTVDFYEADLVRAAREMAAPLRLIHQPTEMFRVLFCLECDVRWPCGSAEFLYSTEELTATDKEEDALRKGKKGRK